MRAARAGPVVDDDLLAERFGELRRHDARHEVGAAAGRGGHDDAHGFDGILLRWSWKARRGGSERKDQERDGAHPSDIS